MSSDSTYPDLEWYTAISAQRGTLPRCPYANVYRCPRFYQSIGLLGRTGISTQIDQDIDEKLFEEWKKNEHWPVVREHETSISGGDGEHSGFHNFCPEVSFDVFGFFASFLHRYADEIDRDHAHSQLKGRDWRWYWSSLTPRHYTDCPYFSLLSEASSAAIAPATRDRIEAQPGGASTKAVKDKPKPIFISYAHSDNDNRDKSKRWLDRLLEHLEPLQLQDEAVIWSDRQIEMGQNWHETIQEQLRQAKAIVLLVSPSFLGSKYIRNNELPVLLKKNKDKGLVILPVIVRPCLFDETRFKYPDPMNGPEEFSLGDLQAANSPSEALNGMSENEQGKVLLSVARRLLEVVR